MAKIKSSFECLVCKQPLDFPNAIDIADFIVLFIQFYKIHNLCENLEKKKTPAKKVATNKNNT